MRFAITSQSVVSCELNKSARSKLIRVESSRQDTAKALTSKSPTPMDAVPRVLLAILGSASLLAACGGGSVAPTSTTPAPTLTLTVTPANVQSGGKAAVRWSSTNATSCMASGGWSGSETTSGTTSTGALSASTSYSLACSGSGGTATADATVTVPPPPTVSITASPASVISGQSPTLTWSATNATSCTASGGWSGPKSTSGTTSTGTLSANTSYILTCAGTGGSVSASA